MTSNFFKTVLFLLSAVTIVSCDKDFNEIGTDLVGDDHYGLEKKEDNFISAASYATGPVETKNLPVAQLGIYNDLRFGKVTANYVTQVELASVNPTLDDFIDVDKVRLYIPYFADQTDTVDEERIYELDSIFGNQETKFDLKIRENNYFLRDQDVVDNVPQSQAYYNDMNNAIASVASPLVLNNAPAAEQNTQFKFSNKEIITHRRETDITDTDSTEVKQGPGMYLTLSKAFFKSKIMEAPEGMLVNNNVFKNYFRGLYFQVSNPNNLEGVLNTLDFSKGVITIYYRRDITTTNSGQTSTVERRFEMKLNLTGNSISLLNYENVPPQTPDKLIVKGGEGYITAVDIITEAERAQLTADNNGAQAMINEANLIFNVDEVATGGAVKPRRLYLYDMTNGQSIVDYNFDGSTSGDTKTSKNVFGGNLESKKLPDGTTKYWYKFRVTNYIRGLINEPDSTRVRFGLSATENILETAMVRTKNPIAVSNQDGSTTNYNKIPKGSAMHPFGVVLHGPNSPDVAERLKLVIYFTRPEENNAN
ncbi:DUF4270 domain-containing protein [Flavobacterium selenitireducens]|uniref:DUF4270 domain-containing protein n=1 Tax=Flavobacterium selenitireducens TaxID=2722704 RepID=UPI00168B8943|nr:DUF4270 domain-containing protein [Flavobacterium selenitireducens]MBD3581791.1 DUF4270 domain-containing protein [Flavobacterium selenitireducens]